VPKAFVSIGSNIEPELHIKSALQQLESDFKNLETSRIYSSKSVGFEGGDFLNLMVSFETELTVTDLYDYLHVLEDAEGRERPNGKAWDSRTLDLDIMLFGDLVGQFGKVELPSKEIEQYLHVYQPLVELQADIQHPKLGQNYADIVSQRSFNDQSLQIFESS